jgi:exodeoxyribonuclease III
MILISFNINGIRANNNKNKENNALETIINEYNPDIISLQEIKCSSCHLNEFQKYENYPYIVINPAKSKKGYSGTAMMSKIKPLNIYLDFDFLSNKLDFDFINEGRVITLEFDKYYIVSCYVPNSKTKLERLEQRTDIWEPLMRKYINKLQEFKPVILCGDLNVAHQNIDIFNHKGHSKSAGFTNEEKNEFTNLLNECNFIDTFRELYPEEKKYTYWSYLGNARKNNKGWRIDYFLISKKLKKKLKNSLILDNINGSDHCPILLEIM